MKEITNADGSRNWEANILLDNIKRLELENAELKAYKDVNEDFKTAWEELKAENERLKARKDKYYQQTLDDEIQINELYQVLQEIKTIAEPFAKCYTHTCRNCEKYDSAHACCLKDIPCYKYNDGSKSSCKDFVLPTKQFYQQILANVITKITKAEGK